MSASFLAFRVGFGHAGAAGAYCRPPGARWGIPTHPRLNEDGANTLILEIADIRIKPGQQAAFEAAIQQAATTVAVRAKGFQGYKVNRGIESPERYVLQIFWDSVEDHTVGFRQGPLFAEWRALIGPYFASPPQVEHFDLVAKSA
jgi:heme-degrading monooxygenase HmoA